MRNDGFSLSGFIFRVICAIGVILFLFLLSSGSGFALAKVSVEDADELKKELAKDGKETIEIVRNISVKETLVSKGEKTLKGAGGGLKRAVASSTGFGGALIRQKSGVLKIKGLKIYGGGNASALKNKLYGTLVEVTGGQLIISDGATLTGNCNQSKASDGGGAVRVHSGGTCVMNGGTISGNACVSGGAGVKVDSGGAFYMKGGSITGNKVVGKSAVDGFEGRGGGVCSRGSLVLSGGSISSNSASAYRKGGKLYGGVGGGVCLAAGACVISGTRITSNRADVSGGGISLMGGSLKLTGGTISGNRATDGDDIGYSGGNFVWDGSVSVGEIWIKKGRAVTFGSGFSTGSCKILPESYSDGVKLGKGLSSGKKKCLTLGGSSSNKSKYVIKLSSGVLILKKKVKPTPTPRPVNNGAGGAGRTGGTGSSGGAGATATRTPKPAATRVPVTYAPVATLNPRGEIPLASMFPKATASPSPSPSYLYASPSFHAASISPQVSETPENNSNKKTKTNNDKKDDGNVVIYYFSKEKIREIKQEKNVVEERYFEEYMTKFMEIIKDCEVK